MSQKRANLGTALACGYRALIQLFYGAFFAIFGSIKVLISALWVFFAVLDLFLHGKDLTLREQLARVVFFMLFIYAGIVGFNYFFSPTSKLLGP